MSIKLKPEAKRTYLEECLHVFICAAGILLCYFSFGIYQERLVQGKFGAAHESFIYIQTLLFFVCLSSAAFAFILLPKQTIDTVPGRIYALCAFCYLAAMVASNQALLYLPYPTQVLAKSCKPIPVLLCGVLLTGKRYALKKYLIVVMIVIGVAMFMYKDKNTSETEGGIGIGEALLLTSLTLDGTTTAIQDHIKKHYQRTALSMMFYMNIFSSLFLAITILATGELFSFIHFASRYPEVLLEMVIICGSSCGGQYFIFKTVEEFSPLTCSILTTTRKLFTIIISVVLFAHPLSTRQIIATAIVFIGLFIDAWDSKKQHSNNPKEPFLFYEMKF